MEFAEEAIVSCLWVLKLETTNDSEIVLMASQVFSLLGNQRTMHILQSEQRNKANKESPIGSRHILKIY
jgi:hypothetical protein